jgi:hypothetical protein
MAKGINIFKPYRKGNFRNVKIATKEHSRNRTLWKIAGLQRQCR